LKKRFFSAPGRIEVGGNHTDHQNGCVLAAAIDLEATCSAMPNDTNIVNIENKQYGSISVDLSDLSIRDDEKESSTAIVRGVATWFKDRGHPIGGFDASISSNIPAGSGLSSSAAFEVLIGNVFKGLYGADVSPLDIALAGKFAENVYFGKPSGLMDQAASSFGGFNMIDFKDPENAIITPITADLSGYTICVVATGGSHADLTHEYASIPEEMKTVATHFGKDFLRDVPIEEFYAQISGLLHLSDRAILRSIHYFEDHKRVKKQAHALQSGDIKTFLELINESGRSSLAYLQNVYTNASPHEQRITLALALSEKILDGNGACRVHGGGFAGTILAFIPDELKSAYDTQMSKVFGNNSCHFLNIRKEGGHEVRD